MKFRDTWMTSYRRSYHDVRDASIFHRDLVENASIKREPSDRGGTRRKVFSIGVAEFGLCRNAVTAISPGMVTYSVGLNNILNRAT